MARAPFLLARTMSSAPRVRRQPRAGWKSAAPPTRPARCPGSAGRSSPPALSPAAVRPDPRQPDHGQHKEQRAVGGGPPSPGGSVSTRTADAAAVTPTAPAASRTRRGIRRGSGWPAVHQHSQGGGHGGVAQPRQARGGEPAEKAALTSRNAHQAYGYAKRARQCFPGMLAPRSRGSPSSRPLRRPLLSALAHTGIVPRVPCTVRRSPVPLTLTNAPICRHAFARPCSTFWGSTPDISQGPSAASRREQNAGTPSARPAPRPPDHVGLIHGKYAAMARECDYAWQLPGEREEEAQAEARGRG